ncbi:APC family permease [Rhodococcus wratislaviensis]|uniref:APC family permease n=1 Tax=Rhodococcus wratislaviensis TaxID=44752 RepID=UPI00365C302D
MVDRSTTQDEHVPSVSCRQSTGLETGQLGRVPLVSLSLASFIPAVGMALVPLLMVSAAGPNGWTSAVLAAVLVSCIGICVIWFARRYVATGSLYSYVGEAFKPWAKYVTAAALVAGYISQVAALAAAFGLFTGSFLAGRGWVPALDLVPQLAFAAAAIAISAFIAYRGLDTSVKIAVALAVLSIPIMVIISIASAAHTGLQASIQLDWSHFDLVGTLQGVAAGAALLIGFESCTALAAETKDPRKNVPIAVMSVPIVLGILYTVCTFLQFSGIVAVSDQTAAGVSAPAALAQASGLGSIFASTSDGVLAIATFAALIGFLNYGSRFLLSVANDGLLPKWTTTIHPRYRTPNRALLMLSGVSTVTIVCLLTTAGGIFATYALVAPLIVYCWIPAYVLICFAAIRRTWSSRPRQIGIVLAALVGSTGMIWVYVTGWLYPSPEPADSMVWVVVLILVVTYLILAASSRRHHSRVAKGKQ